MPLCRRIDEEYEARLAPPAGGPSASAAGKTERKRYRDGEERLKVKARDLDLDDGRPSSPTSSVVRMIVERERGR